MDDVEVRSLPRPYRQLWGIASLGSQWPIRSSKAALVPDGRCSLQLWGPSWLACWCYKLACETGSAGSDDWMLKRLSQIQGKKSISRNKTRNLKLLQQLSSIIWFLWFMTLKKQSIKINFFDILYICFKVEMKLTFLNIFKSYNKFLIIYKALYFLS